MENSPVVMLVSVEVREGVLVFGSRIGLNVVRVFGLVCDVVIGLDGMGVVGLVLVRIFTSGGEEVLVWCFVKFSFRIISTF